VEFPKKTTSIKITSETKKEKKIHRIENLQAPRLPKNWLRKPENKKPSKGKDKIAVNIIFFS